MQPIQIFLLVSLVALYAGLYKFFEKAGEKGWKAIVPFYGIYVWIKILNKPWWWLILTLIPTVSFYMMAILLVETANYLGKRKFSDHVFIVLGYFIALPMWAFSKTVKYVGPPPVQKKKPIAKEWGEAAVFAIVAATLIRTFFFEAFTIPTSSMESTLRIGDYLFVNKMRYGAKVPSTPLTFPFTHNTLPFTDNTPSFLEWVKLPYLRLPAYDHIKNNDVVVFNFPEGDTVLKFNSAVSYYGKLLDTVAELRFNGDKTATVAEYRKKFIEDDQIIVRPIDKEDNYIKRCVAIPGDKLQVKGGTLFINDKPAYKPPHMQYSYVVLNPSLNPDQLLDQGVGEVQRYPRNDNAYVLMCEPSIIERLKPQLGQVFPQFDSSGYYDYRTFPHSPRYSWNKDNYGPLTIPKAGVTVPLDTATLPLYRRIIEVYEGHSLKVNGSSIIIDGKPATSYTFDLDYYFMMGDNRHNSLDSRFWGFVPETHIVGSPSMIWFSKGDHDGIRYSRMFTGVNSDGLSTSFRIWFFATIAVLWGGWEILRRRKKAQPQKKK